MHDQTCVMGLTHLTTRLRNDSALRGLQGYAMPGVGVKNETGVSTWGIGLRMAGPRFVFAQGRSVPTSRGSPPIYDDDR
jgi:hypothetical protein